MKNYTTTSEFKLTAEEIKLIQEKREAQFLEENKAAIRAYESLAARRDKAVYYQLGYEKEIKEIKAQFIEAGFTEADITVKAQAQGIYVSDSQREVLSEKKIKEFEDFKFHTYKMMVKGHVIVIQDGKVNCYSVQKNFRFVKVSTVADRILTHLKLEEAKKARDKKELELARAEVTRLEKEYSNSANITLDKEAGRWVGSYGRKGYRESEYYSIKVDFNSGSSIKFKLQMFITKDKAEATKILISKKDVDYKADRSVDEWLARFNNQ